MKDFLDMDGCFTHQNIKIYYKVTDNWQEKPRVINGVEKIGRYFHFYDDNEKPLGMYRAYDEYEKLQNISHFLAEEYYIKMLNEK